jgi:hypothetical protein
MKNFLNWISRQTRRQRSNVRDHRFFNPTRQQLIKSVLKVVWCVLILNQTTRKTAI